MSLGQEYDLGAFGWNASLSASDQRAAVQAAFDSGERLCWPVGDEVKIDAPLEMTYHTRITGGGPDITGGSNPPSVLTSVAPNVEMIRVTGFNCEIDGLDLRATESGCTGITVGNGVVLGYSTRGLKITRISTQQTLDYGVHYKSAADCTLSDSYLYGGEACFRVESNISNNPASSDSGDNMVTNVRFLGSPGSLGVHWTSGGGLYITGSKFLGGKNHILMDWNWGGSGNFGLVNCSLESCEHISVDMMGQHPFKRAQIVGNTWGGVLLALAVRNFSPSNWLELLEVVGNTADCEFANGNPIMDFGCTTNAYVHGNTLRGYGGATAGIVTRNGTGALGKNYVVGCPTDVINNGGWTVL